MSLIEKSLAVSASTTGAGVEDRTVDLTIDSIAARCRAAEPEVGSWLNDALVAARHDGNVAVRFEYSFTVGPTLSSVGADADGDAASIVGGSSVFKSARVNFGIGSAGRVVTLPSWLTFDMDAECKC